MSWILNVLRECSGCNLIHFLLRCLIGRAHEFNSWIKSQFWCGLFSFSIWSHTMWAMQTTSKIFSREKEIGIGHRKNEYIIDTFGNKTFYWDNNVMIINLDYNFASAWTFVLMVFLKHLHNKVTQPTMLNAIAAFAGLMSRSGFAPLSNAVTFPGFIAWKLN